MVENDKSVFKKLLDYHIDTLQEIGNIGSGHAATAFSEILNRRIEMSLPCFKVLKTEELSETQWNENPNTVFAAINLQVTGDLNFYILILFLNTY